MIKTKKRSNPRRFTVPFAILCILLLLFSTVPAVAEVDPRRQAEAMLSEIVTFASENSDGDIDAWINGRLSATAELHEWYAIGIAKNYPDADLSPYAAALENYLKNNTVYSATTRQKYGLALIACGKSDADYLSGLVDETAGKQGIMSYVFALHLLTNGAVSEKFTPENMIPVLLKLACEDGGWSLTGKSADVDVTAMTVQALAPYYQAYSEVKNAVDAAISRLSQMQAEDGGFSAYGNANPESSAQVMIALLSLGRDPLIDEAFIKNGNSTLDAIKEYRLTDGGYCHIKDGEYNLSATAQTFLALTALNISGNENSQNAPFFLFGTSPSEFPTLDHSIADTLANKNGSNGSGSGTENSDKNNENTENNGNNTVNPPKNSTGSYKLPVCIGVAAVAIALCVIMFVRKKRAISDYILVIAAAIAICLAVIFIEISTPDSYYGQTVVKDDPIGTVTVEIICDTALTGRNDAVILEKTYVEIEEGETVYDLLVQVCKASGTVLNAMSGSATGSAYVLGIDGLQEFAHGDLSGWTYTVNGEQINIGCDKYVLKDGDTVVWSYSNSLGE